MTAAQQEIIQKLRQDILPLQGLSMAAGSSCVDVGLGMMRSAFPGGQFPLGAVHEFLSSETEQAAATSGFLAGVIGALMQKEGVCIWISARRRIFPAALTRFGVAPDHVVFIDVRKEKDVPWAMEESLRCAGLAAVVGEVNQLDFTAARRLQLAVEQSRVTGFLMQHHDRIQQTTACVSRWRIRPLASVHEGVPGVGFPAWQVELLKMRHGRPGTWNLAWQNGKFRTLPSVLTALPAEQKRKAG